MKNTSRTRYTKVNP